MADSASLPLMAIREVIVFPHMLVPFVVGRQPTVRALQASLAGDGKMVAVAQRDAAVDDPQSGDLFGVGTIVRIVQSLRLPDGNIKVLVEGIERAKVVSASTEDGYFRAAVRTFSENDALRRAYGDESEQQFAVLVDRVRRLSESYVRLKGLPAYEQLFAAIGGAEPSWLADIICANLPLSLIEKQELLEVFDPIERLNRVAGILYSEVGKLKTMNGTLELLRHTVATLAYRAGKALRGAPAEFAAYRSAPDSRTPGEILAHMGDLFDWALVMCDGRHEWHNSPPLDWEQGVARFFAALEAFDRRLNSGAPLGFPAEKIFQGPIADALTHVGQIAMLRRMAGCRMRGENYFAANITAGRVGAAQADPVFEFD